MTGMKTSTIQMMLRKKLKGWLESITDENVRLVAADNVIVTGGSITSMMMGEPINDYDLYFKDISAAHLITNYYVDKFNRTKGMLKTSAIKHCNPEVRREQRINIRGEEEDRIIVYMKSAGVAGENQSEYGYFEGMPEEEADIFMASFEANEGTLEMAEELLEDAKIKPLEYRPMFFSENAITLSGKVQLIIRFHGSVEEIHKNFDFIHAQCSYDYRERKLILPHESLKSMMSKSLVYNGSLYPLASMFRCRKFISRGWRITAGQMLKIAHQISNIDLNDRYTLREQLIGVDAAYMDQLLTELNKSTGKVDATYLAKLIDEIFE